MFYRQIPSAKYIAVSRDEVIVKGSALEGFSVLIEDDERRGIAARLCDLLTTGGDARTLHDELGAQSVTCDELDEMLQGMAESGAILSDKRPQGDSGSWQAFVRYGHVPDLATATKIHMAGELAELLAEPLREFGAEVSVTPSLEDVELGEHVLQEGRSSEPAVRESRDEILVIAMDARRRGQLTRFNERAVAARAPFLLCSASGVELTVGPYVVPGRTACLWEVERQFARSSPSEQEYELMLSAVGDEPLDLPHVTRAAFRTAAFPWLVEMALLGTSSLAGRVVRSRATAAEVATHSVMRLPRCPVCMPLAPALRNLLY